MKELYEGTVCLLFDFFRNKIGFIWCFSNFLYLYLCTLLNRMEYIIFAFKVCHSLVPPRGHVQGWCR
jgi:hypothetical protein